jgi:GT2 family glycosyltransferase
VTGQPLVSIIIVNYKDYTYLYQCLNSLARTTYPNIEIIVVDNDSDVTLLSKLKDEHTQVNFFPLRENLNYAEGNNYGIKKSKGDFIILLNNDTAVQSNWIEPLVKEALINPRSFYQPIIYSLDNPDIIFSLGGTISPLGIAFPIGAEKHISEVHLPKEKMEVFYCAGACVFTSREILNELDGLDSNYWTFYEDVNLGWKGRLHGYPSFIVPDSTIYHKWGGTHGRKLSQKKLYLLERGRVSSILKNFSIRSIVILSLPISVFDLFVLFYLIPKHMATAKVRASLDVLRNLKLIIKERKKIQMSRTKNDAFVSMPMTPSIEHPLIGRIPSMLQGLLIQVSKILIRIL